MTYFGVLVTFIVPPLILLLVLEVILRLSGKRENSRETYLIILAHVLLALIYTTPWDNYLVATNVWWYDPALVTGLRIGYVPIEEYTFFIVQTVLTGLWTILLMRVKPINWPANVQHRKRFRVYLSLAVSLVWLVSTAFLLAGWQRGTYLTLILSWALIPLLVQLFFGADILLSSWRLILPAVLIPTIYLWMVDAAAITSGTWTISTQQTTGIMLGNLPLEEMVFFLMTNLLIGLGVPLMLHPASKQRADEWRGIVQDRKNARIRDSHGA